MSVAAFGGGRHSRPCDRQDIVLNEVLIPAEASLAEGLRPLFDMMAQAAGFESSQAYDDDGRWRPASSWR